MLRFIFAIALFFCTAGASFAQETTELHVVNVHKGNIRTGQRIHGPEVKINLVRPEKSVVLAIGARTPVRVLVTTEDTTELSQVFLFDRGGSTSEVYVNGEQITARYLDNLPATFSNKGVRFRQVVTRLTEQTNLERISSFQSAEKPSEDAITISKISEQRDLQAVYLPDLVQSDRLSEALRPYLSSEGAGTKASFTNEGFTLDQEGVEKQFAITLDVPPVSHPVAAAYDAEGQRLFGVSLGGEGFLYAYDIAAEEWSVVGSMNNVDATGLVYDGVKDRLLFSVQRTREGSLMEWSEVGGFRRFNLGISVGSMPGITDLYEPGNRRFPTLVLLGIDGQEMLVRAIAGRMARNRKPAKSRSYIFNLETGEAIFVAYEGD